jgi:glycosidase
MAFQKFSLLMLVAAVFIAIGCTKKSSSSSSNSSASSDEEFVPQWAKTVVWYQVFPDRFRNGDPSNDPTVQDIIGADPQPPPEEWEVHPWGSDWYELQNYEKANGESALWMHQLRRRYGGDLQGVINKLDYLKELGISAIYMNPVFDAPSLHKYDGASYHHIDPNFGPDPEGDRKLIATENPLDPETWVWTSADELALKLIDEAHKRDIKIIFDGVFNHLGINSFAFQDVRENQQNSPYKDWFTIHSWRDEAKGTEFEYQGWFGVASLPEFKEDEDGIVEGPKEYIFNATERWMNPKNKGMEHGIDGWRLDVAFEVAHPFWKDWRIHVKSINPEAYLTAEIVDEPENVKPYMQGDEFDGEMNYNFAFASAEFSFNPESTDITPTEFDKELRKLRNLYPTGVAYVNQNLFGSHDANRIGSHIVNRDNDIGNFRNWGQYFGASKGDNPNYDTSKPQKDDIELQKLFVILQMTYVGAPMIYYGDEVGMWGGNDPDSRKPMIWEDISYDDEVYNADGSKHAPDEVEINYDLLNHYKKLISIRNKHKALQIGDFQTLITDDERELFGFTRTHGDNSIHVVLNNSDAKQTLVSDTFSAECYTDLISEKSFNKDTDIVIPAKWGVIFKTCE